MDPALWRFLAVVGLSGWLLTAARGAPQSGGDLSNKHASEKAFRTKKARLVVGPPGLLE
jgi:hypothetical protein